MADVTASIPLPDDPESPPPFAESIRHLFAHAIDSVFILDAAGTIVDANPAACAEFGRAAHTLRGLAVASLVIPGDADAFATWLAGVSEDEVRFETVCRVADGAPAPFIVAARTVVFDGHSCVICTMRRDEWRQLRRRVSSLSAIVETSDDAIVSKLLDGTVTSWNPAAERLYGWTADEMVGHSVARIVPEDRREELASILARLGRNERIDHHETVRVARDGRRIDVSVSISPIRDVSGRVVGATKIGRDVTERRRLERQQREFLSLAAHELRTPLTSLKVSAQLLQRRSNGDDQLVDWVLNRINHLGHLIDDLVDAARFDSEPTLHRGDVDLVELARATIDDWQLRTNEHVIRLSAGREQIIGNWDATRIEQVLSALLENAITYAPGGEIVVQVDCDAKTARMTVADEGPGISPELLPSLFERFVRLDAPGMSAAPGLGLGLYHCRMLVKAHGGAIRVAPSTGHGATFVVELPLSAVN